MAAFCALVPGGIARCSTRAVYDSWRAGYGRFVRRGHCSYRKVPPRRRSFVLPKRIWIDDRLCDFGICFWWGLCPIAWHLSLRRGLHGDGGARSGFLGRPQLMAGIHLIRKGWDLFAVGQGDATFLGVADSLQWLTDRVVLEPCDPAFASFIQRARGVQLCSLAALVERRALLNHSRTRSTREEDDAQREEWRFPEPHSSRR